MSRWQIDGRPIVSVVKHEFLPYQLAVLLEESSGADLLMNLLAYEYSTGRNPVIQLSLSIVDDP